MRLPPKRTPHPDPPHEPTGSNEATASSPLALSSRGGEGEDHRPQVHGFKKRILSAKSPHRWGEGERSAGLYRRCKTRRLLLNIGQNYVRSCCRGLISRGLSALQSSGKWGCFVSRIINCWFASFLRLHFRAAHDVYTQRPGRCAP